MDPGRHESGLPFTVTFREAAAFSGIPVGTLRRLLRHGDIRGLRTGPRRIRVHRDSLLHYLNSPGSTGTVQTDWRSS